jgi:cytochrome c553
MIRTLFFACLLALSAQLQAADPAAGKEKSKVCAACHGETGAAPIQDNPKLAGQYYDYLVRALSDYKSGKRKNPIMPGMVANLTKEDIADLAAYFSSQPAVVSTRH